MARAIENELQSVLKHFTFQQICFYAVNEFPEIIWDDIVTELDAVKRNQNKQEVIKVFIKLTRDLDERDLSRIITNLQLLAIALATSKTWYVYELQSNKSLIPSTTNELIECISSSFRKSNLFVHKCNAIDFEGKFVMSIIIRTSPKRKNVQPRILHPIYCIFDSTNKYVFIHKLITDIDFKEALAHSLGYEKIKFSKLSGKKIDDLNIILRNKDNKKLLEFKTAEFKPEIKENGPIIDFTQNKDRLEYADDLYGENPPELQHLTFSIKDDSCIHELMADVPFQSTIQISSTNVTKMLKNCIENGIIDTPVPDYLQEILKKGKNTFNMNYNPAD